MIIPMYFTFQISLLAIAFGTGYWILVEANNQEDSLKVFGKFLGWILIASALFITLFNCYYSIKMYQTGYMQEEMKESLQEEVQEELLEHQNAPIIKESSQQELQEHKNAPIIKNAKEEATEERLEEQQEHKNMPVENESEVKK